MEKICHSPEKIMNGYWKPLFKGRYYQYPERDETVYESFFAKDQNILMRNPYPYIIAGRTEQYLFWINKEKPRLSQIAEYLKKLFPRKDWLIYFPEKRTLNKLYCHIILKNCDGPTTLTKFLIFHRHANREQIYPFPIFSHTEFHYDAPLIPLGIYQAYKFAKNLENIYRFPDKLLANLAYYTSPVERCQKTAEIISRTFPCSLQTSEDLICHIDANLTEDFSLEDNRIMAECLSIIPALDNSLQINIDSIINLYDIYSSVISYREMGYPIADYLSPMLEDSLKHCATIIYNVLTQYYLSKISTNFLDDLLHKKGHCLFFSTHDNIIFLLAKYLCLKNGTDVLLELPDYLANIRIEHWSDGDVRIYYNNLYLGSKY